MKKSRITKVITFVLSALMVFALAGCGSASVAATVNGVAINEDDVTAYIGLIRYQYGISDDSSWTNYLTSMGMSASDVRSTVLQTLIGSELVNQAADAAGVTVDDSTIENAINTQKMSAGTTGWNSYLSSAGITEGQLRKMIKASYVQQAYATDVLGAGASSENIAQYISENSASCSNYDGAKKSSHILLSDEATAQSLIQEINDGADFATLAEQYSEDTGSATDGGNVGWDSDSTFVTEYQTALDGLSVGQMTQTPVQSDYGYHIILCTAEFNLNDTSVTYTEENTPTALYETVNTQSVNNALDTFITTAKESAEIVINDMPSGLPYDVSSTISTSSSTTSESSSAQN